MALVWVLVMAQMNVFKILDTIIREWPNAAAQHLAYVQETWTIPKNTIKKISKFKIFPRRLHRETKRND